MITRERACEEAAHRARLEADLVRGRVRVRVRDQGLGLGLGLRVGVGVGLDGLRQTCDPLMSLITKNWLGLGSGLGVGVGVGLGLGLRLGLGLPGTG